MTSDGEALFRAICEQPWEDTPRLVYADWLEENGDQLRAEFIRVQCELARETDPPRVKELRARSEALQRESRGRWTRGSPTGPGIRVTRSFHRGFYRGVTFSDFTVFTDHADEVFAWMPVDALTIWGLEDDELAVLAGCSYLKRVSALSLAGPFGEAGCRALARAPLLEHLLELTVSGQTAFDGGALAIAESMALRNVQRLRFRNLGHVAPSTRAALGRRFAEVHAS